MDFLLSQVGNEIRVSYAGRAIQELTNTTEIKTPRNKLNKEEKSWHLLDHASPKRDKSEYPLGF
jgi:hypothetical protein